MKKIYLVFLFILVVYVSGAQNLPYLNASTGNINEFPVDKDTNIYIFHGNRLVKTDKNFNVLWANTYNGLSFSNVLLSKTGSMYFIAGGSTNHIYFGKLHANGNVSWVNTTQSVSAILSATASTSYTLNCVSLFLDRNNNLLVSGDNFLLKTDTNGNAIKLKIFNAVAGSTQLEGLSIINDSAGTYKLAGAGAIALSGGSGIGVYSFSDLSNTFTSVKNHLTGNYQSFSWGFLRSKFSNNFYARLQGYSIPNSVPINQLAKLDMNGNLKWFKAISNSIITPGQIAFFVDESKNGDLFYATGTYNSSISYTSAFLKLDSNGVANNFHTCMLYNYNIGSFSAVPNHAPRSVFNGSYYFDVSGYSFPNNPLTIQKFNSTLSFPCTNTVTDNSSSAGNTFTSSLALPTIQPVTSFTLNTYSTTAAPLAFSVNPNFCLVMNANDRNSFINNISLSPNPTGGIIKIKLNNNDVISEITVTDITGKKLKQFPNATEIDVNDLSAGIYYLQLRTNSGLLNQKFIKE